MNDVKNSMEKKESTKYSLLTQIAFVFIIGVLLTTLISYFALTAIADEDVRREKTRLAKGIERELDSMFREYTAYEWVIAYLIDHAQELDPEYDSDIFTTAKEADFYRRYNGMSLRNMTVQQLEQMPEEDQRTFAEIVYNDWLRRMNDMKAAYELSLFYFAAVEPDYRSSMFLLSAKGEGQERGTEAGQAFTLGFKMTHTDAQYAALYQIDDGNDHHVYSEDYIDFFTFLFRSGDKLMVSGVTFDIREVRAEVRAEQRRSVMFFIAMQIFLAAFSILLIYIWALRPLDMVKNAVVMYSRHKDGSLVRKMLSNIRFKNEIWLLSQEFIGMSRELDEHMELIKAITEEQERISAELDIATGIQADMLPTDFDIYKDYPEFSIYASMDPAREVGGDFYDFFMPDEDHIALVMADVSGKGIPAALFMVIAKTLIKNRTLMGGTPSQILADVNEQICEADVSGYFVTVWLAIIDIHSGKGLASNAGHEHPVLRRSGGEYELVKYRHSVAVATMEGMKFEEHGFELHPGDRIFVYTDGVPEATDSNDEMYGTDRMLKALNGVRSRELKDLLTGLQKDIDAFVGDAEQFDDTTMLVFEYRGGGAA